MNSSDKPKDCETTEAMWLRRAFWCAVLSWCSLPLSSNATDSDFWGHVQYGRDLLAHGLPQTSTYAYTALEQRWINHELLSELIFAFCCDTWGSGSLVLLKSLFGMVLLTAMIRAVRRRGSGLFVTAATVIIVAWNLAFYWGTRPQVASFLLFGMVIALLTSNFRDWNELLARQRKVGASESQSVTMLPLLWCVPIFIVWANAHGGFLAGLGVILCYLACRSVEWMIATRGREWTVPIYFATVGAFTTCATLLNPYGWHLHLWLLRSLGLPRPEIAEWHPPELMTWESAPLWALLALGITAFLARGQRRDKTEWIVMAVVCWQVMEHQRHIPFLAILAGFWLPGRLSLLAAMCRTETARWCQETTMPVATDARHRSAIPFAPVMLTLLVVSTWWFSQWSQRIQEMRVAQEHYPVSAFRYISEQNLQGRLFATGRWGQYVIAAFGARRPSDPGLQVGFDGRFRTCYPQSVIDMHFDFTVGDAGRDKRYRGPDSPPFDARRALREGDPDLVLVDRREPHAVATIQSDAATWSLLYQDRLAQVWGRRSRYDQPGTAEFIPMASRKITETFRSGWVSFPAIPAPRPSLAAQPPTYRDTIPLATNKHLNNHFGWVPGFEDEGRTSVPRPCDHEPLNPHAANPTSWQNSVVVLEPSLSR